MSKTTFTAFYPSHPFWAVSELKFGVPKTEGWFYDQMVEEVYSITGDAFALKMCRDGRILMCISHIERENDEGGKAKFSNSVRLWGDYLDYLNAFYLLLDSATLEIESFTYFNLHEITSRDAFRVTYLDGIVTGEVVVSESLASTFQFGRSSSNYRADLPIEYDPRIRHRRVVSLEIISHAVSKFETVVAKPGLEKTLAAFAKSLAEYKIGNYETSVVLAWFITEAAINALWIKYLDGQNSELPSGKHRLSGVRKKFLTGRDFTTSIVLNIMELSGVLDHGTFEEIDAVRGFRNKIVHGHKFSPKDDEAQRAIQVARAMIEKQSSLRFQPNLNYSFNGL